jgi:hypothetical protein
MARAEGTTTLASSVRKKRPVRVFFVALLISVLYFALFPYPLGLELVARPAWSVSVPTPDSGEAQTPDTRTAVDTNNAASACSFQLGDVFGYADASGSILHAEKVLFRVSLSDAGFINYTRLGTNWILQNPRGGRVLSIAGNGYPMLSKDGGRIFNVKSDLTGMIELDKGGDVLWNRDFPALMTSASVAGGSVLIGLLNGTLLLLNAQGSPVYQNAPGGSRIPIILGDAVASDGSLLAAISGIGPQYLVVFHRQGSSYGELAREALSSDFRREVRMAFPPDARYLLFEGDRSAGIFDPGSRRISWVPLGGALAALSFPAEGRFAALAARDGARAELRIVSPFTAPILSESFTAHQLFLGGVDGGLLLGMDGRLLRIDIVAL